MWKTANNEYVIKHKKIISRRCNHTMMKDNVPLKLPIMRLTGSPDEIVRFRDDITGRPAPTFKNITTRSVKAPQNP